MIAIPAGFQPQEYLAHEHQNPIRHEYRIGLVYPMVGGSDAHSRLGINLLTAINLYLRNGDCQFFAGDVKVNCDYTLNLKMAASGLLEKIIN